MRKLLIIAAAVAPLALAAPAFASDDRCPELPAAEWLGQDAVKAKVEGLDYKVRKVEVDDNCYEVEGTDANGAKFEAYVDPKTGEIVPAKQRS